jgi:uncharacterized protein YndB with AHSA1/START domain
MTAPEHSLSITRTFSASADDVYSAWTDPAVMARWMGRRVDADVRVGGSYRTEIDAGDTTFVHSGEYRVLEPGRRIVHTFRAGPAGADAAQPDADERIEIDLRPLSSDRTEVTFTDAWRGDDLDEEGREAARQAWSGWLDGLERLFGQR